MIAANCPFDILEDPDDDGWTGKGLANMTLLSTCVVVCGVEVVVLRVVGELITPGEEPEFGFAGKTVG
jgi:hypothetical protein